MNQNSEQIHHSNNSLLNQIGQELLTEKPQLVLACQCHIIDPNKMRILLWKDIKDGKTTYILKIAEQKFVGTERLDKREAVYWKFRELYESENKEQSTTQEKPSETKSVLQPAPEINQPLNFSSRAQIDRLTKFQERQAKTQQLNQVKANANNSESTNSS